MKLLVAITDKSDAEEALDALLAEDVGVTRIDSTDGFLHEGKAILLIGVEEDRTASALDILREHCRSRMTQMQLPASLLHGETRVVGEPIQVKVGGALAFFLNIDHFEHL